MPSLGGSETGSGSETIWKVESGSKYEKKNSGSTILTVTGSWKDNSTVVKKLTSKMSPAKGGSLLECSEKQCRK